MARRKGGAISAELLDQLLAGRDPQSVLESGGLMGDLKKALAERMLNAEMGVIGNSPSPIIVNLAGAELPGLEGL